MVRKPMLRRMLFLGLLIVPLMDVSGPFTGVALAGDPIADNVQARAEKSATHTPFEGRSAPSWDGQGHDDLYAWSHDYLAVGALLRGPLGALYDTLSEAVAAGRDVPRLSVRYVSPQYKAEPEVMEITSFEVLRTFIAERKARREELETLLMAHVSRPLAPHYRVDRDSCAALGLWRGWVDTKPLGLDYGFFQDQGSQVAMAVENSIVILPLQADGVVLHGYFDGDVMRIRHEQSGCDVRLIPQAAPNS